MSRSKKLSLLGVGILSIGYLASLSACGSASTGASAGGNTLRVAAAAFPSTLDPHGGNEAAAAIVNRQVFETLVYQNTAMEIQPGLAKSWEYVDDRTIEFKLEEGVTFHNGEAFTAEDVVFSLNRALDSTFISHIVEMIDRDSLEAVDDYTVRVGTTEPFSPLLSHLSHPATAILDEGTVMDAGETFADHPIGTGPFKYEDRVYGETITLVRNEDYYKDLATIDGIEFRTISEGSSRLIALETDEVDINLAVDPADVKRVEEDSHLTLVRDADLSTSYLGFNVSKEPFNNKLVRQAINYAVDVEGMIEAVYEGIGARAVGPIGSAVFGYHNNLAPYEYNPEKAKELLAEAGYPDGFTTTILTDENNVRVALATVIQNQLAAIGIQADVNQREWATYISETAEGKTDMFLLSWSTVTGDADYGLDALFHSRNKGAAGNRTFYENAQVDRLLDEGKVVTDEGKRLAIYEEVQEIIVEEAPWLFIRHGENLVGINNRVENFELHPAAHHNLSQIKLAE